MNFLRSYTNLPFCNVLQIMKEKNQAKKRLNDMKTEVVLEGTTLPRRRNSFAEVKQFAKAKGSFANAKLNDCKRRPLGFA